MHTDSKVNTHTHIKNYNQCSFFYRDHQDREVAIHGHDGIRDMCIKGLTYKKDLLSRRQCEQKIISLLGCAKVLGQGVNVDIRFPQIMLS